MTSQQRRIFLFVSLLFAGLALGFISFGNIGENLVYYWDSSQVVEAGDKAYGATIRLGGVVQPGTLNWDSDSNHLRFEVGNGKDVINVRASGAPPRCFVRE